MTAADPAGSDATPADAATRTYRAGSGPFLLGGAVVLAALLLGDAVVRGGWQQTLLLAPWVLLVLWLVYEVSVASGVRVSATGVRVQNMLRRTQFGWRRVRDIDLRWQLVFLLDDGVRLTCFGGPARARPARNRFADAADGRAGDVAAAVPAGVRELTEIRDRWQAAVAGPAAGIGRDAGAGPGAGTGAAADTGATAGVGAAAGVDAPIRRSWDAPALLALVAIVVWAAIAVAVTR